MLLARGHNCAISPIIPCNITPGMQFQQNPQEIASMGHDGSSGVLIMLVSIIVPEKLLGKKV